MHDEAEQEYDSKTGPGDRGPQTDKQKYSYNPGEHIQYRRPNRGTTAQCHHCVRSQSDANSQPEHEESQAGRTVGES
jgi:hypothetical protein